MFDVKNQVLSIKEIPQEWIYQYYLGLDSFEGFMCIRSPFKEEKSPSFKIYGVDKGWKWKDWATGKGPGSPADLVMQLYNLSYRSAANLIESDYNNWVLNGNSFKLVDYQESSRYRLSNYNLRNWNKIDSNYWLQFGIGSVLLEKYNIKPISDFTMEKPGEDIFKIEGAKIYGYFDKRGTLVRIYRPDTDKKMITLNNYIQGSDQLEGRKVLLWTSSMKDGLSVKGLSNKLQIDFEAPNSESTLFSKEHVEMRKKQYKYIFPIMDNDETGIESSKKYQKMYGLTPIYINVDKDLADVRKNHGASVLIRVLIPAINKSIEEIDSLYPDEEKITQTSKLF